MAVICITGSSDGIGLATAQVLVAEGHRVLIHARVGIEAVPVLEQLGGETTLVRGILPDFIRCTGSPIRSTRTAGRPLVHSAGVWVAATRRGRPPMGSTTFAVNVWPLTS